MTIPLDGQLTPREALHLLAEGHWVTSNRQGLKPIRFDPDRGFLQYHEGLGWREVDGLVFNRYIKKFYLYMEREV